ncbi:hypothetical protein BA700_11020 [Corynebacterium stationis]|nr:hypothetical protein BA700_11020 [Corynebacterium stationis]
MAQPFELQVLAVVNEKVALVAVVFDVALKAEPSAASNMTFSSPSSLMMDAAAPASRTFW